jgi:hypothetical protein
MEDEFDLFRTRLNYAGTSVTFSMEDLYQAFKARLMAELVAEKPGMPLQSIPGEPQFFTAPECFPLVAKEG